MRSLQSLEMRVVRDGVLSINEKGLVLTLILASS
jgi:hypothetical protein